MNVNQIKTIFLVLAAIAKGTHACNLNVGESCFNLTQGDCCYDFCDSGGSGECRKDLGESCDGVLYDQCFQGEFGSIFHMICNSRYF